MQIWNQIHLVPETGTDYNTDLFQARNWHTRDWNDDLWLVDDNCLHFNVFSCCNLITNYEIIVYVSHVCFRNEIRSYAPGMKFSFQAHMVRKTGAENWHQKTESIYSAGFWSVCHGYWPVALLILILHWCQPHTGQLAQPGIPGEWPLKLSEVMQCSISVIHCINKLQKLLVIQCKYDTLHLFK